MKPLAKPMRGLWFWLGKFLVSLNWARTWTWAHDEPFSRGFKRTTYLISLHLQQYADGRVVTLVAGPARIMVGWRK